MRLSVLGGWVARARQAGGRKCYVSDVDSKIHGYSLEIGSGSAEEMSKASITIDVDMVLDSPTACRISQIGRSLPAQATEASKTSRLRREVPAECPPRYSALSLHQGRETQSRQLLQQL